MSAGAETVLTADCIGKRFGDKTVLSAATVHAERGVVTALIGRNGCGKSTLLRIMAGVMAPDHGTVRFRGAVYTRTRLPRLARQGLFLLPADRSTLTRTLTLRQHLDVLRRRFSLPPDDAALEELKITHLLDRTVGTYSGGEQRRAELALALARAPDCLLADEPFLGITPVDTEVFITAFRALARRGTAVIVTGARGAVHPLCRRHGDVAPLRHHPPARHPGIGLPRLAVSPRIPRHPRRVTLIPGMVQRARHDRNRALPPEPLTG